MGVEINTEDENAEYYMEIRYDKFLNTKAGEPRVIIFESHRFYGLAMSNFKRLLRDRYPNTSVLIERYGYFES